MISSWQDQQEKIVSTGFQSIRTEATCTHPYTLTPEGKRKYSLLHWGTVDKDMKFTPGSRYIYASHEERSKLVFPEDWDMSLSDKLSGKRSQGRPAYQGDDVNRFYSDVWLLEQVALKTGIRQDLLTVFEGNAEMVDDILTLSFFPYLTGYTYNRLARWQRIARTPSREELTPTMIIRLTQSITESERMELFRLRADRLKLNLYFDAVRRGEELTSLDIAIES